MSQPSSIGGMEETGGDALGGYTELRLASSPEAVKSAQQSFLSAVAPDATLVQVSYEQPPSTLVEEREAIDCQPADHGILWVSAEGRIGARELIEPEEDLTVGRVNPHDLTGLAMKWVDLLNMAGETNLHVTFESISALLQYAETDDVYQLLQMLTGQIRRAGGRGQFYLHAEAHTEQTANILKTIFDDVRRVEL